MTQQVQELKLRRCTACGSEDTYYLKAQKRFQWHLTPRLLCHSCYCKYISNPKQLWFKDRRLMLKECPRCGVCCWCRAVVGQYDPITLRLVTKTHMHHEEYHEEDPLKDAIEVCIPCHRSTGDYFLDDEEE